MKINKPKQILSLDGSLAKHKFAVVFFMPGQLKTDILFILNVFLHIYFKNDGLIKSITVFIIYASLQFFFKHTKCSNVFIIMKALRVEDKKCVI